jgi:predicted transcriptional regulator
VNSWETDTTTKRRDKLYIIAEILEIAGNGTLKTQIMYRANLSFAQLNEYLKLLLKIRLLEKFVGNRKDLYRATEKGSNFLQRHREITELLKTEEENGHNSKNGVKVPPPRLLRKA